MGITRKDIQRTIDAITAVLPPGWAVRTCAPLRGDRLEVYHGGEAGGGVVVDEYRFVKVIEPHNKSTWQWREPTPVGDYRGSARAARVAEGVLKAIRIFRERYAYALPPEDAPEGSP